MVEDLREEIEDAVANGLYDEYDERVVDRFLRNYDDEILTSEMTETIDKLNGQIRERIQELITALDEEHENDDDDEE